MDSLPPSAENYKQAIDGFKSRFGRKGLLIEVYITELLGLVLNNYVNKSKILRLADLYETLKPTMNSKSIRSNI